VDRLPGANQNDLIVKLPRLGQCRLATLKRLLNRKFSHGCVHNLHPGRSAGPLHAREPSTAAKAQNDLAPDGSLGKRPPGAMIQAKA
jgi:hypothetical protein